MANGAPAPFSQSSKPRLVPASSRGNCIGFMRCCRDCAVCAVCAVCYMLSCPSLESAGVATAQLLLFKWMGVGYTDQQLRCTVSLMVWASAWAVSGVLSLWLMCKRRLPL